MRLYVLQCMSGMMEACKERTGEYLLDNVFQIFQALFFMIYEDYIHAAFSFRLFVNWGSEGIPKMPCPHPHVGSLRSKMLRVFNPPDT
ncbi:MAG: hypothetical protein PUD66_00605 [Oscillospiraceae bacterium]|nr:hypothetical protein [Oscillospiraceae bacterium]